MVYAPRIYDMTLIVDKNTISDDGHLKAYLMMEIMPQNTGGQILKLAEYQKWEYQKPYLLDVFRSMRDLLKNNVAMTDLKPDNTLYDTSLRRATIIDLGGTVKLASQAHLFEFDIQQYNFQNTPKFTAPELTAGQGVINLSRAISFSCGKLAEDVITSTDLDQDENAKLTALLNSLCSENPADRLDLDKAFDVLASDWRRQLQAQGNIHQLYRQSQG